MITHNRRQQLLEVLQDRPDFGISEMAKALKVSQGTIRNDLNALQDEGRVKRVHGGAVLLNRNNTSNNSFDTRYDQNTAAKIAIAQQAAQLISDGDSVLFDASSTAYYVACAISHRKELRVVTNGFHTANELARNDSNRVALIGGMVNFGASSVTGLLSEQVIEDLYVQKAFLSCSGFSLERGMTELHLNEAHLKRKVIHIADHLIALIDSSKFGKEDLTPFARAEGIYKLFTDQNISKEWEQRLLDASIDLVICDEQEVPDHEQIHLKTKRYI